MFLEQKPKVLSHSSNIPYNVVAIAASLGGLKAISNILSALPSDFPAAITIVQHLSPLYPSYMAEILSQRTAMRVKQAEEGELLRAGTVYMAVPGKHLLVNPQGTLSFSDAAKVHFSRPAGDKLFTSLAASYKSRAIAIVLTGRNGDGATGVLAIKKQCGIVIVQNEADCECFSMPKNAIETGEVDFVLPLNAIAAKLISLVMMEKAA